MSRKKDNTGWRVAGGIVAVVALIHLLTQKRSNVITIPATPILDTPVHTVNTDAFTYEGRKL